MQTKLELNEIASLGRTFDEYYKMFSLGEELLESSKILDVASGSSSFCAEARAKGYNVIATDAIYSQSPEAIQEKCQKEIEQTVAQLPKIAHVYKWNLYKNPQELGQQRQRSLNLFIKDFQSHKESYLPVSYPKTNFEDKQFDITLVSHFLFVWEERLSYDFHLETILELARITKKEIRIFPIVNIGGQKLLFINSLVADLKTNQLEAKITKVDYEFVKGGNEMLVIKC